jgi:ATP-binding cassette subfamily B protein
MSPKNISIFSVIQSVFPLLWTAKHEKNYLSLRLRLIISLTLVIITICLNLLLPWAFKNIVQTLSVCSTFPLVLLGIGLYGGIYLLHNSFWIVQEMIVLPVIFSAAKKLHLKTYTHLQNLSLSYHMRRKSGWLGNVLSRINHSTYRLVLLTIFYFTALTVEITATAGVLWYTYSWYYALTVLGIISAYVLILIHMSQKYNQAQETANNADNAVSGKTLDNLINYQTIKFFSNESFEQEQLNRVLDQRFIKSTQKEFVMLKMFLCHGLLTAFGVVILTTIVALDVVNGQKNVGDFILVNGYLIQLTAPLTWLGMVIGEIAESINNLRQVLTISEEKPDIIDASTAKDLVITKGHVRFKDVEFAYNPKRKILKGISFEIIPGQTLAIVGATGAGKSTLSQLLYRFYDLNAGEITIDGQNITNVTQQSLRRAIGIVPQDTSLFNETILYNIRYGNLDCSEEDIVKAAQAAGIHDFIMTLPDAYLTEVGERGLKLSGGEKQRIAIARCLLKKPKILIFDEATSALDTKTERAIQENLKSLSTNITTLIIAHRLSTIVDADQIIVLDKGTILEQGTHETLLLKQGKYTHLWQQQTGEKSSFNIKPAA